jgi:epoxyqueuosine reductase
VDYQALVGDIRTWATELGFAAIGISDIDLDAYRAHLDRWLDDGLHGEMAYMARGRRLRIEPQALEPYAARVISARMNYLPPDTEPLRVLRDPTLAYVSRYALGRDYHKVVRPRLARLADRIRAAAGGRFRAFVDSAPVLEKALGAKAGLGWIGKHTLLLDRDAGSFFFLGEIYTDLPLPTTADVQEDHCGRCSACMTVCPTQAIVAPHRLDARRCISYLTIEYHGVIPEPLRRPIGNRIFGCDDCQLVCPWNRYAKTATLPDFAPRQALDRSGLLELFEWTEDEFLARTAGSALRRLRFSQWLRNLAVALGNAPPSAAIVDALERRRAGADDVLAEHIDWAIAEQRRKLATASA